MSGIQKQQQNKQTQTKSTAKKEPQKTPQSVNFEQLVDAPETMRSEDVLAAQKQVGNQVVQRALDGRKKRDAMTDEQGYLKDEINEAIQKKRGGGSSLPDTIREDASKRLKHDFSDVHIHTDEQANELSQSINARAFTIGKDIFFKKGVFSPNSRAGRETLMHELTHVVQQSGGGGGNGRLKLGGPDTAHEKQADKVGKANSGAGMVKTVAPAVQRDEEDAMLGMPEEEVLQPQPDTGVVQRLAISEDVRRNHNRVMDELKDVQANQKHKKVMNELKGVQVDRKHKKVMGELKGRGLDDDALQRQPDSVVQREEMPEEELMMQEEEEVQMQPDAGVVQRDPRDPGRQADDDDDEKHKLLMRDVTRFNKDNLKAVRPGGRVPDDDAVQMQPDVGVVQRDFDIESEERQQRKEIFETLGEKAPKEKRGEINDQIKTQQAQKRSVMSDIQGFDKSRLKKVDKKDIKDTSVPNPRMTKEEKHDLSKKVSRRDLMETLKDPSKSPEEIEKAQAMLKDLHGVKKKEFKQASKERRERLKSSAESGDQAAYDKWKAEKKPSKMAKFGKGAFGLAKGFFGSAAKDLKTQLFGPEEKKEEKKDAPAPTGGGGAGLAGVLEEKIAENQKLKALLKKNNIPIEGDA